MKLHPTNQLSRRQWQVANLVASGHTYPETAHELGVSVNTVSTHVKDVYDKLGCSNRMELANKLNGSENVMARNEVLRKIEKELTALLALVRTL